MANENHFLNAELMGVLVNMFLTGVYYVCFIQCIVVLRRKLRDGTMSKWLPVACTVIFVLASGAFAVNVAIGYQGFGVHGNNGFPDPSTYFANISSPTSFIKGIFTVLLAMFSDVIMIYRVLVVWSFLIYVAVVPICLLMASWGVGFWVLWTEHVSGVKELSGQISATIAVRFRDFFILTFCFNILCASLICWRVWKITSRSTPHRMRSTSGAKVVHTIVESAALYCAILLALIVTEAVGSNVFFVFNEAFPPVTAIVFSLLIIRSHSSSPMQTTPISPTSVNVSSRHRGFGLESPRRIMPPFELQVGVSLERMTHSDHVSKGDHDGESMGRESPV